MSATAEQIRELIQLSIPEAKIKVTLEPAGYLVQVTEREHAFRVARMIVGSFLEDPESGTDVEVRVRRLHVRWYVRIEYVR